MNCHLCKGETPNPFYITNLAFCSLCHFAITKGNLSLLKTKNESTLFKTKSPKSRYLELISRKELLMTMVQKTDEELNNQAMLMLAKAMDPDAAEKATGSSVLLKAWLKEVEEEMEFLSASVMSQFQKDWEAEVKEAMTKADAEEKAKGEKADE